MTGEVTLSFRDRPRSRPPVTQRCPVSVAGEATPTHVGADCPPSFGTDESSCHDSRRPAALGPPAPPSVAAGRVRRRAGHPGHRRACSPSATASTNTWTARPGRWGSTGWAAFPSSVATPSERQRVAVEELVDAHLGGPGRHHPKRLLEPRRHLPQNRRRVTPHVGRHKLLRRRARAVDARVADPDDERYRPGACQWTPDSLSR